MIYAIATTDQALSHQFSKSQSFTFYNEDKKVVAVYKNPALDSKGCGAKLLIVDLFKKMQCELVIVRKIGEKTLGRLLDAGIKVEQGSSRSTTEQLLADAAKSTSSLISAGQGIKKKDKSCCGDNCSHDHDQQHQQSHTKKRCCGKH